FNDMHEFYSTHLGAIYNYLSKEKDMEQAGSPSGIYYNWDEENGTADVAAAIPFSSENKKIKLEGYQLTTISGKAYKIAYYGSYEQIGDAHQAIHEYFEKNAIPMSRIVLEEYVTDPAQEPDT